MKGTKDRFHPIQDLRASEIELTPSILVLRVEQSLYFANSGQLHERLRRIERFGDARAHPAKMLPPAKSKQLRMVSIVEMKKLKDVIIDVGPMPTIDATYVDV